MLLRIYANGRAKKKERRNIQLNKNVQMQTMASRRLMEKQYDLRMRASTHARDTIAVTRTITEQKNVYKTLDNRKYTHKICCCLHDKTFIRFLVAFAIFTTMTLNCQLFGMCEKERKKKKRTEQTNEEQINEKSLYETKWNGAME